MSLLRLTKIGFALILLSGCETLSSGSSAPAAAPAPRPAASAPASPGTASAPAQPAATAPTTTASLEVPKIEGMRQDELVQRLGPPAAERDVSPAKVLSYRASGCDVAIYLYFDTGRNGFFALHYDVNGRPAPSRDADRCLRLIAAAKRG